MSKEDIPGKELQSLAVKGKIDTLKKSRTDDREILQHTRITSRVPTKIKTNSKFGQFR